MSTYKMICLDIDGTLINNDKIISAITKQEISRVVADYAVKPVLASSRMPKSLEIFAKELNTMEPMIAYNGALILNRSSGNGKRDILFSATIDCKAAADLVSFATRSKVHTGIFWHNDWFVNDAGYWTDREIKNTKMEPVICDLDLKISEWKNEDIGPHKIMLRGTEQELDGVENYIKTFLLHHVIAHRIKDTILEIAPLHISKGSAVAFLCDKEGLKSGEVIAFGDSYNDIDMLRWAGVGVAMANAPQAVKDAASESTASNNEDGIALVLKKYFS